MTDPLFFWRLHDEMTVPDAAILMVGGDPSEKAAQKDFPLTSPLVQKRDYPGFDAASGALKGALLRGGIEGTLRYSVEKIDSVSPLQPNYKVVAMRDLWPILAEAKHHNALASLRVRETIQISREPNWEATTLKVESLRRWLRSRGATDAFFVSAEPEVAGAAYLDPSHEHFAPELALAVAAWQSLASEQRFVRGPKATIEAWIDANPDAWLGEGELSASAKERIVTLVNWRKIGGAPSSGG